MNYLAHAYLSFGHSEILAGNMISDFVKGGKKFDYPPSIQKGIMLHRYFDTFTDTHEATKEAKQIFRPDYRLYSGAFVDVVYDHFLATDSTEFSESTLQYFSREVYAALDRQLQWMPDRFAGMYPYMKKQNWLYNYQTRAGTWRSIEGVVRRSVHLTDSETAFKLFEQHYQLLQDCFRHFWASAKPIVRKEFDRLQSD